jgi:hypothetical protein
MGLFPFLGSCEVALECREIPPGSPLRKQLFDLARPSVQKLVLHPFKFRGSLKESGSWAFFLGEAVDSNERPIAHPESGNSDTCALWKKEKAVWLLVDYGYGFTNVFYGDWPERHGAPSILLGLAE